MSPIFVIKSTGQQEAFDPSKLLHSLMKAGSSKAQAEGIVRHIQGELVAGTSTSDIYRHAFDLLRHEAKPVAARYSMKRAIAELGPSGFPFERLIAEIFKAKGYEAVNDQTLLGECVDHEVDVVAWNTAELVVVEAKFHNEPGLKSDVKVALYVKARFDDLKAGEYEYGGKKRKITSLKLFTNTKFTDHAVQYAECKGLSLIGWNYPEKGNLEDLVSETRLHPLTSLTTLTQTEKRTLLGAGLVLCKQLLESEHQLADYGIEKGKIPLVLEEVRNICK